MLGIYQHRRRLDGWFRGQKPWVRPRPSGHLGFTLIELVAVLVILAILAVVAVPHYASLLDDSKSHGAQVMVAAAQSQLSLEFARRATSGLALDADSQPVCTWVIISSPEVAASILCVGNLDENVAITATIDGKDASGAWSSPLSSGS